MVRGRVGGRLVAVCYSRLWQYQLGQYVGNLRDVGYKGVLSIEHETPPSARKKASGMERII